MSDFINPISSVGAGQSNIPLFPFQTGVNGSAHGMGDLSSLVEDQMSISGMKMTPEQQEKLQKLMEQIQPLIEQLNACLARGDTQGAQAIMQQISSLINASGIDVPENINITGSNIFGASGDAPVFYPLTGASGIYNSGGQGLSPVDLSGVRATLPGDGNQNVVNTALDIASKGYPYVWGGDGPQEGGYDCSGFTHAVYAKNGINIPRTAQTQYDYCKKQGTLFTDVNSAKPGDLIFFDNPYAKKTTPVGHVMIYLGNGKMVGAQSDGVKVYNIDSMKKYIVGYGRPHN